MPDSLPGARGSARIDLDDVGDVRVTLRAIDSFRFQHGGSAADAETELRIMIEDFLLESARRDNGGYLTLSRSGYAIVLSPDRDALVGYRTIHRERTWTQVKAGVRSRLASEKRHRRAASGDDRFAAGAGREPDGPYGEHRPVAGPSLPDVAAFRASLEVETVYVSLRALTQLTAILCLLGDTRDHRERSVRTLISDAAVGTVETVDVDGTVFFEAAQHGLRWRFSPDGYAVIGVTVTPPR